MKRKIIYAGLIILSVLFSDPEYAEAQNLIATIEYSYNPVNSGFDGVSQLYGSGNVFRIPALTGGSGFGIAIGGVVEMRNFVYAVFKYTLTSYDAFFQNEILGKAYQNSFGTFLRLYPRRFLPDYADAFKESRQQFYFLAGIDIGILNAKKCHYIESRPEVLDDAIFTSLVLPVGLGISIRPSESFTFDIDAAYRFGYLMYIRDESAEYNMTVEDDISVSGFRLEIAFTYYFPRSKK